MITTSQLKTLKKLFIVKATNGSMMLYCRVCDSITLVRRKEFTREDYDRILANYKIVHPRIYELLLNHKPGSHVN